MKVGIINHWMVNNYGAVALAFALEQKIRSMGYDVETIQWLPDEVKKPWKVSQIKKAGIVHYIFRLGYFMVFILPREKNFKTFRNRFHISYEKYNDRTLPAIADVYDKIMIGGDQLWNYKENYLCRNNFLPFVKERSKKIVYAASLSQDNMREDFRDEFKRYVDQFFYITTREYRAQEIIKETCRIDAHRVTDPAFLLSREEWLSYSKSPKEKEYIFVYQVQSDVQVLDFAKKLAKERNCQIVFCPFPLRKQMRCKRRPYISIEKWLGYLANANCIVTDAFHGVVFSLIFNREFYCEISEYGKDTSSRIINILKIYGLEDRLMNNKQQTKTEKIDWNRINTIIEKEVVDAEYHIRKMLAETNGWGGVQQQIITVDTEDIQEVIAA